MPTYARSLTEVKKLQHVPEVVEIPVDVLGPIGLVSFPEAVS